MLVKSSFTCNSLRIRHIASFFVNIFSTKNYENRFVNQLSDYFQIKKESIFLFGSGRMGLYSFLKSLNLDIGDEVIIPGYTCVVVPNAIKYAGLVAKYVDIKEDTLNIDTDKLLSSITKRTKAIVVSHNFGIVYEDVKLIKKNYPDIIIIEDVAHTFGSVNNEDTKIGLLGDAAFFSLEYSKPITTGMGGILIVNNSKLIPDVRSTYDNIGYYPRMYTNRILITLFCHFITSYKYSAFLKSKLMRVLQLTKLQFQSSPNEVKGEMPTYYPVRLSSTMAYLGLLQVRNLQITNELKNKICKRYYNAFHDVPFVKDYYSIKYVYVRYPLLLKVTTQDVIKKIKRRIVEETGLTVGEWFNDVVHPKGSYRYCYTNGSCVIGEKVSREIINLPVNIHTNIGDNDLLRIKKILVEELVRQI